MKKNKIYDVKLIDLIVNKDSRGQLFEILRKDAKYFFKFGQVYITTCSPGWVKGWHYHKKQCDRFCVVQGKAKVVLFDMRKNSKSFNHLQVIVLDFAKPQLLFIPSNIIHGFCCLGKTPCHILNITTELYNRNQPDEYRIPLSSKEIPYKPWRTSKGW